MTKQYYLTRHPEYADKMARFLNEHEIGAFSLKLYQPTEFGLQAHYVYGEDYFDRSWISSALAVLSLFTLATFASANDFAFIGWLQNSLVLALVLGLLWFGFNPSHQRKKAVAALLHIKEPGFYLIEITSHWRHRAKVKAMLDILRTVEYPGGVIAQG